MHNLHNFLMNSFCLTLQFQNGQTPLMLAAEQGNLEIVQELLKKGANCNLEDAVCISTLLKYLTSEEE